MEELLEWDDSYIIGDREIDEQHRKMFDLINSLPDNMSQEDIKGYILIIVKHAREHFRCEEALMARVKYPHRDNHIERHTELLKMLSDKCLDDFHGKFAVQKFKVFLYHWIRDHIIDVDSVLFDYVNTKEKNEQKGIDLEM